MHILLPKMKGQVLLFLLLAWLLLAVSQPQDFQKINVQATDSVHSNLRPRRLISRAESRNELPTWAAMKRNRKSASGPNPVGNQHPPSRQ
ncbi:hypothetical protein SLE2022_196350 [Rubroshorea leprosula]